MTTHHRSRHLLLTAACAAALTLSGSALRAQSAGSHVSEQCPLPPGVVPWTIVARSDSPLADQRFLHRTVRAIAQEFDPAQPIRITPRSRGAWELGEPAADSTFSRSGWRPGGADRAIVRIVLFGEGLWSTPQLVTFSGDQKVAAAAVAAVERAYRVAPLPIIRDTLPRSFASERPTDSLVVMLLFGEAPTASDRAVARFAMQEVQVEALGRPNVPIYPAQLRAMEFEGKVMAQFIVDASGTPDIATFSARPDVNPGFIDAVRTAIARTRYRPAQVDCRVIPRLVQQEFTFRLGR